MGVLLDENISPRKLENFPVIYLPNTAVLSTQEIEMLKEYVANGGLLLATGLTGLYTPTRPTSIPIKYRRFGGWKICELFTRSG